MRRLLGWFRAQWRFLLDKPVRLAIVLIAMTLGFVSGLPASGIGFTYLWADPHFCNDCHVHDYANDAWERSPHAGLTTCHDCHRVPIIHYPRNLVVTFFPPTPEEMPRPHVETVICEQCHSDEAEHEPLTGPMTEETRANVVKVDRSPLHKIHLETTKAEEEIGCMTCHKSTPKGAHRFEPTSETCLGCHEEQGLHEGRLSHTGCRDCHASGFLGLSKNHKE